MTPDSVMLQYANTKDAAMPLLKNRSSSHFEFSFFRFFANAALHQRMVRMGRILILSFYDDYISVLKSKLKIASFFRFLNVFYFFLFFSAFF